MLRAWVIAGPTVCLDYLECRMPVKGPLTPIDGLIGRWWAVTLLHPPEEPRELHAKSESVLLQVLGSEDFLPNRSEGL